MQMWNGSSLRHAHTWKDTHKHAHPCTSVWCAAPSHSAETEWTGLFSPLSAHGQPQCLHESCVWACVRSVCVWECEFLICRRSDLPALYLHMHTIWLTAMPYLFCLATSRMHTHPHMPQHTFSYIHTLTYRNSIAVFSRGNDEREQ